MIVFIIHVLLLCLCERAGLVPYASSCFLPVSADQPLTAIQGLESLRQLPESKRHLGSAYPSISIYSPKLLGCQEQNKFFFSDNQNFFHLLYHLAPGAGILNYTYTHKGKG
jgi:hypothetical protein